MKGRDLGVIVDASLKFCEHVTSVAHKAAGLWQSFLKATVCHTPEFMLFFFVTHVRPILICILCVEYWLCERHTETREDTEKVDQTGGRIGGVALFGKAKRN